MTRPPQPPPEPVKGSSRDLRSTAGGPMAQCDLCEAPMTIPTHCTQQGAVLGLLVCTQCIEDELEARNHERSCHAH